MQQVALSTYQRHAKYREADKLSPEFRAFLTSEKSHQQLRHVRNNRNTRKMPISSKKGKEKAIEVIGEEPDSQNGTDDLEDMVVARIIDIPAILINTFNSIMMVIKPMHLTLPLVLGQAMLPVQLKIPSQTFPTRIHHLCSKCLIKATWMMCLIMYPSLI
jgi:hypothetical protein